MRPHASNPKLTDFNRKVDAFVDFMGNMVAEEYDAKRPLPTEFQDQLAAAMGGFIGPVQSLFSIKERLGVTGIPAASMYEGIDQALAKAQERVGEEKIGQAAEIWLGYINTDPQNTFPIMYRKALAAHLNDLGQAMDNVGILLPEGFLAITNRAKGSAGTNIEM